MIEFTIPGEPYHQERHRHKKGGKGIITYDPSSEKKKWFLIQALNHRPRSPLEGPIYLEVITYHSRPKHHYRTGKYAHLLKDSAPYYKITKPDADNEAKFVMDALNEKFWKDDEQVASLNITKVYSDKPRTYIKIQPLIKRLINHNENKNKD